MFFSSQSYLPFRPHVGNGQLSVFLFSSVLLQYRSSGRLSLRRIQVKPRSHPKIVGHLAFQTDLRYLIGCHMVAWCCPYRSLTKFRLFLGRVIGTSQPLVPLVGSFNRFPKFLVKPAPTVWLFCVSQEWWRASHASISPTPAPRSNTWSSYQRPHPQGDLGSEKGSS